MALLDLGALVDATGSGGYPMLMRAISWRRYDIAGICLARGCGAQSDRGGWEAITSRIAATPPDDRRVRSARGAGKAANYEEEFCCIL